MRPSLDEYFLKISIAIAERSTCRRRQIGAVAVRDKYILATGYNGAPSGTIDCLTLGCLRDEQGISPGKSQEICRAVHAEQNVIIQASMHGVSLEKSTIYCFYSPCILCAKMLVNAKISRQVFIHLYPDRRFMELYNEVGIVFEQRNLVEE